MGKRKKSSRGPVKKKKEVLATSFQCLFCNHEKSVSVRIDKKAGVGSLICKVCGQSHQCEINYLSAPIDVYSDWIDAADAVNNPKSATSETGPTRNFPEPSAYAKLNGPAGGASSGSGNKNQEDNLDGFIEDDEEGMEGEYNDY